MAEQDIPPRADGTLGSGWRLFGILFLGVAVAGLVYAGAANFCQPPKEPTVGGRALFADWPQGVKPNAVLLLSGQTFGFIQPCGCSRPQKGGLERRANLMSGMRAKGWPVAGFDLGDVHPARTPTGPSEIVAPAEQMLLKYTTTMNALREMGYVAVGLGQTEFAADLYSVLAAYALQKEQPPFILAANVTTNSNGKPIPRESAFPGPGKRPMVGMAEMADIGGVLVGVAGAVGKSVSDEAAKADPRVAFLDVKAVLGQAVTSLAAAPRRPAVNVLLYQGSSQHAKLVAKDWPQFQLILCLADDPEPPQFPEYVSHADGSRTMVVQVGHKGLYVGAVGLFKKDGGGFDLKYQLVPLGEEYLTPDNPVDEKANKVLALLEEYAAQVKARNLLAKIPQRPHGDQIRHPNLNLSYVGSERCMGCHAAEYAKWKHVDAKGHAHGVAMEALEKVARRPGLRNLDGECVVCHTIGFGYKTGYENDQKTPALKNVGCENCHGPGSGHMSNPRNQELLALMSPWKQNKGDKLPEPATMKKLADLNPAERGQVQLPVAQQQVINKVSKLCMNCHDGENDPRFDLFKYWPKIDHTTR